MPKNDPAGYLPSVKKARKGAKKAGKSKKAPPQFKAAIDKAMK